ncbi:MAG: ADP-dependent glucokinase/phosphofructokinase [Alphaproteobacteria bacterium]
MQSDDIKSIWAEKYSCAASQLEKMKQVKSVVTAFNANIDAITKLSSAYLQELALKFDFKLEDINNHERSLKSNYDVIRGIIKCFVSGNAEEWLIDDQKIFAWIRETFEYDRFQLGGQGGVVANAMAVCGVQKVFAHSASLPKEQAELFLNQPNLVSTDENEVEKKAYDINRDDLPLIHWIFEFNVGDKITIDGKELVCPKSNRFIATYDPLNFSLHIDQGFSNLVSKSDLDYIVLSGYHLLRERLADGTSGIDRIEDSLKHIREWQKNSGAIVHLEVASTQDENVRKYIFDNLIGNVDSIGLNDREAIDLLEVSDEKDFAETCDKNPSASNLFKAIYKIFNSSDCQRIQLHMFGLYVTIQQKGFKITPEANLRGMMLASVVAASKAGTGSIDVYDNLLWSKNIPVHERSLKQIQELSDLISNHFGENSLASTGIYADEDIEIIAVPTILVDKPLTLVGMGDTISSVSLVGAR